MLTALKTSHLEPLLRYEFANFCLAYRNVGASAIAGRGSGVIDPIFSPQNRSHN